MVFVILSGFKRGSDKIGDGKKVVDDSYSACIQELSCYFLC